MSLRLLPAPLLNAPPRRRVRRAAPAPPPRAVERPRPPDLSLVVPVLDEVESLPDLATEIAATLNGQRYELIFVDDGSRDGSYDVLRRLQGRDPRLKVVRLRRNFGKTAALSAGFRRAAGRLIVTLDADLQDDPAEIPRLVAALEEGGFDLVTAWRRHRHDRRAKRVSSWCFNRVAGWASGLSLRDMNCGLKVFRREVVEDLDLYGEMHRFLPILAHGKGFRVGEVPVRHRGRRHGLSKYGSQRFLIGSLDLLKVLFLTRWATRPLRLFGTAGLALLAVGLGLGGYLTALRLSGAAIGNRPLLWLAVLLITAGLQVLSIGLIGELIRHLTSRPGQEYAVAETLE